MVSVNDKNFMGLSLSEAESSIKSLPRGAVKIVAMPPPRDVTGGAAARRDKGGSMSQSQSHTRQTLAKSNVRTSNAKDKMTLGIGNLEPTIPPSKNGDEDRKNEEEGVVNVTVRI